MKLNTELKDEKAVKKKLEEKKPVRNRDTQTSQTETSSVCTDTLFTKIDLTFDTHDNYISCLCKCHGNPLSDENPTNVPIENCEIASTL